MSGSTLEGSIKRRCVPGRPLSSDELGKQTRAKIRNGYDLPSSVDGRCLLAKRFKELSSQILIDQNDGISEVRLQLIRRFVGCCVLAEQIEKKIIISEPINLAEYSQLISSLVRVAQRIGIDRLPKNITPDLRSYLEARASEVDPEDEDDFESEDAE